ncbi:PH domain-containing protein [Isoptericola hypogeus]|uniref:PH domain-containing protein n=1 Tax=Isoptericola hypogeus TaxID=300179 RepID=A0ABN2JH84_9MICO
MDTRPAPRAPDRARPDGADPVRAGRPDGAGPDGAALRLRPPEHPLDPRVVRWWVLRGLCSAGLVLLVLLVAWWLWVPARPWLVGPVVLAALATVVRTTVEPRWRYAVHRWQTTPDAVYGLTGWVVREWRVAPLSRVQTVDAVRGPLEQLLGLATLRVTTASSNGALRIVGLDQRLADEVAEALTAVGERTPGDAT